VSPDLRQGESAQARNGVSETQVTVSSTVNGGKPGSAVENPPDIAGDSDPDLAAQTLASARAIVSGPSHDGSIAVAGDGDIGRARSAWRPGRRRAGYRRSHAPGDDGRGGDPLLSKDVVARLFTTRGWDRSIAEARVFADWSALVGRDVAAHCAPVGLVDGELRIAAESTAWATQLRLLGGPLLASLTAQLGPTLVTRLHITGPVAPSWNHGRRTVRGGRGPRDTYG
jgi:predicted nucleic acid-binding Zn ribbon protein